jgi:hypothetical protein
MPDSITKGIEIMPGSLTKGIKMGDWENNKKINLRINT